MEAFYVKFSPLAPAYQALNMQDEENALFAQALAGYTFEFSLDLYGNKMFRYQKNGEPTDDASKIARKVLLV